jgi:hypothetical protein
MQATVKIEKIEENGSSIRISAICDTVAEVEEITRTLKQYAPRTKIFGLF